MAYKCGSYEIIEKMAIGKETFSYLINSPEVAEIAKAGQFVHVKVDGYMLRRPISICEIFESSIRIIFEVRGGGTKKLSELGVGDNIDMIAPLGKGFTLDESLKKVIIVGGGIGTPPLLSVANFYGEKAVSILGFRSYEKIILSDEFQNKIICTDDGSVGIHGLVTKPLREELQKGEVGFIYACGPNPMIKGVLQLAKEFNVESEVSLEERMGCGVGACACCVVKVIRDGSEKMVGVCKEGPVFKGSEVVI